MQSNTHRHPQQAAAGRRVMIVAGEASGDLHGANLVRAMLAADPHLHVCGMGGRELEKTGMDMLYDAASLAVVGITEVLSHLGDILRARRVLIERMRSQRPDLLILVDYPDFNLLLAAKAKKMGIPIMYYISPQIWAWRSGRVHTIKKLVDRMVCILPFEKDFYARYDCPVDYVGHPLVDTVHPSMDRHAFCARYQIDPRKKLIGLLPGSRRKEIASLLPTFLEGARLLAQDMPEKYTFLMPQASTIERATLSKNGLDQYADRLDIHVISKDRYAMMAACDAVVAASGTVILELALLGTPTVAAYRMSRHTYLLGRMLIRQLDFFTLVNLIGGRRIIPELLQDEVTPKRIADELTLLLDDQTKRRTLQADLSEIRQRLGEPGASARAAAIAMELLSQSKVQP